MMRTRLWATTALALGVLLSGCQKKTEGGGGPAASTTASTAGEKAPRVHCPARLQTAARPAGAPVDDVVGVRPGLTYDEAANLVQCEDKSLDVKPTTTGFDIESYGQRLRQGFDAKPREPEMTSQEILKKMHDDAAARGANRVVDALKPGQQLFYVSTIGPPDQDRVVGVWREQWFEEGRNPPLETVRKALTDKYGPPTLDQNGEIYWLHDAMGRPLDRDSPLTGNCLGRVRATSNGFSLNPDCGLTVAARIVPLKTNPDLARSLELGIADQAKGYAAIEATEKALAAADAQRRAKEVQRANQNADAPKL
ncbi:hypothetical protein [Phenylobacterium sp.]|uniref:hypothetical protein n=1 Tax=Phenylobacterium sp. TaxID=1871053 RepID=UPI0025D05DC3|nr:hypothetical protein [Phenylobacterium sp.]MBX3484283.1 hypothetical protein [Phenylobacterium sp.]